MASQKNIQELLKRKLEEHKKHNPRYSLRAFAQKLAVTPGTLSQVLLGKRKISEKLAYKLADALKLSPAEKAEFLYHIMESKKFSSYTVIPYEKISEDVFTRVNDIRYWGILNLATTADFQSDPAWIAQRLGLDQKTVEECLRVLVELQFLVEEDGRLRRTTGRYIVDEDIRRASWKNNNLAHLALAQKKIEQTDSLPVDCSTITFPVDMEKFEEAQTLIRKFQEEFQALCSSGRTTEVYRMGIQLIPITTGKDRGQ